MIGCVGWCFSLRASKVLSFSPATESSEQGRWTAPLKSLSSSLEETSAASDASGSLTFRCRWRVWGCSGDGKCGRSNSALICSLMTLNRLAPLATTPLWDSEAAKAEIEKTIPSWCTVRIGDYFLDNRGELPDCEIPRSAWDLRISFTWDLVSRR